MFATSICSHAAPHYLRIETYPEARTIISGQPFSLSCIISFYEHTEVRVEALTAQWLNVTSDSTFSDITLDGGVSVGNLTAVGQGEYNFSLQFLTAETYHSGEYVCQMEVDRVVRQLAVNVTFNRM